MFLFEKSSIGAYCNKLYDLKKAIAPFHAMAELKQIVQEKNLNVTNINTKAGRPNR